MTKQFDEKTGNRLIEWTDMTLNRIRGCFHGCGWDVAKGKIAPCYASVIARRRRNIYRDGFEHHYYRPPKKGEELRSIRLPHMMFLGSMSDPLGSWVPADHLRAVLDEIRDAPQHIGQILTKHAPGILKYLRDLPENLWVGASCPPDIMYEKRLSRRQQEKMLRNQLRVLSHVRQERPEIVPWMSFEPLGWDVSPFLWDNCPLRWAVIGATTIGSTVYPPDPVHVQNLLDVLDYHTVPVFFKGKLIWTPWREDFPPIDHPALHRRQQLAQQHGWTLSRVGPTTAQSAQATSIQPELELCCEE
jgi:protein gp37